MSGSRCPRCGGLVAAGAEWCGQCLAPLGEGGPPAPQALEATPAARPAPEAAPPAQPREGIREAVAELAGLGSASSPDAGSPSGTVPTTREPAARRPGPAPGPSSPGASFGTVDGRLFWACPTCDARNALDAPACRVCGTAFSDLMHDPEARPAPDPSRAFRRSLLFPGLGHVAAGRVWDGVARAVLFAWVFGSVLVMLVARSGGGLGPFPLLLLLYVAVSVGVYATSAVDARRAAESRPPWVDSRLLLYGSSALMLVTVATVLVSGLRVSS